MKKIVWLVLLSIVLLFMIDCIVAYPTFGPPPLRGEAFGVAPRPGFVWIGGYWRWSRGNYVWVSGSWVRARPGRAWVPGTWEQRGRNWHWRHGYWR